MKRKLIAMLIVAVMAVTIITPASASIWDELKGINTLEPNVVNIILPANLNFALDPSQVTGSIRGASGTQTSQVVETPFRMANVGRGTTGVIFFLEAEFKDGVNATISSINSSFSLNNRSKDIHFGVIGAHAASFATETDIAVTIASATELNATTTSVFFDNDSGVRSTALATIASLTSAPSATPTTMQGGTGFVLQPANAGIPVGTSTPGSLLDVDQGLASFMFYAEVNPFANWSPGDISVSGVYWLVGMPGQYVSTLATRLGHNTLAYADMPDRPDADEMATLLVGSTGPIVDVTAVAGATTAATIPRAQYESDGLKIKLPGNTATVTEIRPGGPSGGNWVPDSSPGARWTYDASDGVLELYGPLSSNSYPTLTIVAGGNTFTINLTLTT